MRCSVARATGWAAAEVVLPALPARGLRGAAGSRCGRDCRARGGARSSGPRVHRQGARPHDMCGAGGRLSRGCPSGDQIPGEAGAGQVGPALELDTRGATQARCPDPGRGSPTDAMATRVIRASEKEADERADARYGAPSIVRTFDDGFARADPPADRSVLRSGPRWCRRGLVLWRASHLR
jgi:hypothetical protein